MRTLLLFNFRFKLYYLWVLKYKKLNLGWELWVGIEVGARKKIDLFNINNGKVYSKKVK